MCSTPVSQPSTPTTPAGSISTTTMGILPPARLSAEDLTKATLRDHPTYSRWLLRVSVNILPVNQWILTVQVNEVETKAITFHPQSQECLLHTPVHLALAEVQQVAAVKIPMS